MKTINPKEISVQALQGYLQNSIAPRPIALASTIDNNGNVNLSPFSFFNVFGTNPPTLIFSPNRRVRDGSTKHTYENILELNEVVIHLVDFEMVEQMSLSSCEYEKGINEFIKAGFSPQPSVFVKPPRISEAKVAFECKVNQIITMGEAKGAANLLICEVILIHISESILDENQKIDPLKTDWVARMGGDWYCRASGEALFELPKPTTRGIGFEKLPEFIKLNSNFTKNELARLALIETLPSQDEIEIFNKENTLHYSDLIVKTYLADNKIKEAWLLLLSKYDGKE